MSKKNYYIKNVHFMKYFNTICKIKINKKIPIDGDFTCQF